MNNNIGNNNGPVVNSDQLLKQSPKGLNVGCLIGGIAAVVVVVTIIVASVFGSDSKDEDKDKSGENDDKDVIQEETAMCDVNSITLSGLKGENLDYYYNIDTSKFDKNKFDGNINFHGVTVNGKITTNKLKNAGVLVNEGKTYLSHKSNEAGIACSAYPKFSIDTSMDIINNNVGFEDMSDFILLCDYTGGDLIYSDNTLVTFGKFVWNLSGRNIYPSQLGINNYGEITIDLIIEKLGNPTYVLDRTDPCLSSIYSYTIYVYVYDDVAFLYGFYNWDNLDLASVYYYPIEDLNGVNPVTITYNNKEYSNYIDYWDALQKDYLNK